MGKKIGLSDTCLFKVVEDKELYFQEAALVHLMSGGPCIGRMVKTRY